MNSFEKKMLIEILKTLKECDDRIKTLEARFYDEPTMEDCEEIITPITQELFDEILSITGNKLIFMGIA